MIGMMHSVPVSLKILQVINNYFSLLINESLHCNVDVSLVKFLALQVSWYRSRLCPNQPAKHCTMPLPIL